MIKTSSGEEFFKSVKKRDGQIIPFEKEKITKAVLKAMLSTGEGSVNEAEGVCDSVVKELKKNYSSDYVFNIEEIQDAVEKKLMELNYANTAKAYIIYRKEHAEIRAQHPEVPTEIRQKITENSKYFKGPYNEFIFYQMYSRWRDDIGRRETWEETIDRFMAFMKENLGHKLSEAEYKEVRTAILNQEICPSMRLLWASGDAARKTNVTAYNCSYLAPTSWQDLGEVMYISMCGAGLGFSVEAENVEKFPQIKKQTGKKVKTITVEDSKEGWANAFVAATTAWVSGKDADMDYSKVRPVGARLMTMGGRASGPQPLRELMDFAKRKILAKQGRRLSTLDLHDIICKIGLIVVAGGVRRSALISLSDLDDDAMRDSKKGQFYLAEGQRSMANNSAVYNSKPSAEELLDEWTALVKSRSGERGIFNRGGLESQVPPRRWKKIKREHQPGLNPCGEIILKSKQFCNLTSIVVRPEDDKKSLMRKMKLATIIGTYQATLTNFQYLSSQWKKNCEEERLLGVSITGYYDNKLVRSDKMLDDLREEGIKENKKYAKKFGINESTAITCVKPHGNSGQLLGVGSGMHPWFAPYYIRRVRISVNDPMFRFAREQGIPYFPEVGYSTSSATTMVLEFPIAAPKGAVFSENISAMQLLEEWKRLKTHFTEHNPSVTIYVNDDEWIRVANFIHENWEIVGGLSFLPHSDHVYQLAPYEKITKEEYERRVKELGEIDFSKLLLYEREDNTIGAKEAACVSGTCEI
jgi:ribonucleoside-diphosphate reductase alpha chain